MFFSKSREVDMTGLGGWLCYFFVRAVWLGTYTYLYSRMVWGSSDLGFQALRLGC